MNLERGKIHTRVGKEASTFSNLHVIITLFSLIIVLNCYDLGYIKT